MANGRRKPAGEAFTSRLTPAVRRGWIAPAYGSPRGRPAGSRRGSCLQYPCSLRPHSPRRSRCRLRSRRKPPTSPPPPWSTKTFKQIKLSDYRGKYVVLFFYPLDFTFVCPTEIIAFSDRIEEFEKRELPR